MRILSTWTRAALICAALAGAASADVTVSSANDPRAMIGEQLASVMGAEHSSLTGLPETQLASMASGPEAHRGTKAGSDPYKLQYTDAYLADLPAPAGGAEWDCLRKAIYFEARGESIEGEFAVAEVILNRVDSPLFPRTICGVVRQSGHGACAFSWVCDGFSDVMHDAVSADRAGRIAMVMMAGAPRNLTGGATFFHTRSVRPSWSRSVIQTAAIGSHVFYRHP